MIRPGVIILREGTDTSQGKPQLISNINACQAVADSIRTTLGPLGMDKLVFDGRKVTISNDGATIMKLLDIAHPAAKTLVDISMSQDDEVGDGTTSVVLLASEILKEMKPFVEEGVHPQILSKYIRLSNELLLKKIEELSIPIASNDNGGLQQEMLIKCASTALNSKLLSGHQDLFSPMVVKAVQYLHESNALEDLASLISIKKIPGGDVRQSFMLQGGIAFKKTFSYAGFEQMSKKFTNPKILLLNVELELKSERENAEVRISSPEEYQAIVDAEWDIIYDKLSNCVKVGANIVLSKLPIGDLATQYFADRGLFCAGRVEDLDMKMICKATGAMIQTTTNELDENVLGTCGTFEEKQVGDERFNVFLDCPRKLTTTIVLRGGSEQFIAESERSIHDSIQIVKRALQSQKIVAGGGAIEMELSKFLKEKALEIKGKGQFVLSSFAKALEIVPRQLADNAGYDSTDVLSLLRSKHNTSDGLWFGADIKNGGICDTYDLGVWEPSNNKCNCVSAASEAACVILSIDETVRNPKSQDPGAATGMLPGSGGAGRPMTSMMENAMDVAQGGGGAGMSGKLGPGVSYMKGRGG